MSKKIFIYTFLFIFSCHHKYLIASESEDHTILLKTIIEHASIIENPDDDKTLEHMVWKQNTEKSYPVFDFFKGLLFGKKLSLEQRSRYEVFEYICESLYTKHFLISDSLIDLNKINKNKIYITLAFCQYTYFFPYEHAGFIIEYYNKKTDKIEATFYELTFKSWWDAFTYAFMENKKSFRIFKKGAKSIIAGFCMHPTLKTPDKVRWYPYKTFESDYNQGVFDWLNGLAEQEYIPYSFFGTKKVNEHDEIVGKHNCISFTIEVLQKLNIFNTKTLGEVLSYPHTYPISQDSIFHPFHSTIAHNWFNLPESLKHLADDETILNKKGVKRPFHTHDESTHEAPTLQYKRLKSDEKARVTVEQNIKRKIVKAFKRTTKKDINKKRK